MDLSLLIANDTAECVIIDPYTDEQTDIVVTVHGPYSNEYEAAFKKDQSRKVSDALELLIDLTVGWTNLSLEGKALKFTRKNAAIVYGMKNKIVKRQVERFILNNKNFLPKR
jgi:hypothetical protein